MAALLSIGFMLATSNSGDVAALDCAAQDAAKMSAVNPARFKAFPIITVHYLSKMCGVRSLALVHGAAFAIFLSTRGKITCESG
jgi:hypothetical protein